MFAAISASIEYTGAGRLRPLAVTTATRSEALPDTPTVGGPVTGIVESTRVPDRTLPNARLLQTSVHVVCGQG